MKIVWLSHSADVGGAELSLREGAQALVRHGHQVEIVLPTEGPLADLLRADQFPVHVISHAWWMSTPGHNTLSRRLRRLARNLCAIPRLVHYLRQATPCIVVSHSSTIVAGALAARWLHIPHVWNVRELFGSEGHDLRFDWGERFSLWLFNLCSARIILASETVRAQYALWLPPHKLRVVYSAIELAPTETPATTDSGVFRLIHVGTLTPAKRQNEAIQAVALLNQKGIHTHLLLVGPEHEGYGESLRQLACRLNVVEQIEFIGFSSAPARYIAGADLALLCSRGEAFPRVSIEAMKLGKPVIGADSAGLAEQIKDGQTGFLYQPGNIEQLAAKIELLYSDRARLAVMGHEARQWATQRFSLQKHTDDLLRVFDEALHTST